MDTGLVRCALVQKTSRVPVAARPGKRGTQMRPMSRAAGANRRDSDVARAFRASPSANSVGARRRKESPVSALRTRDLASHDLWERSLHRSRERRRIAAIHRKTAPRRKGVSLAISAALLTTPVLPSFAAARGLDGSAPTSGTGGDDLGRPAPPRSLLKFGSEGSAVRKIQQALGLIDDGIFGPQTREAVLRFQRHARLSQTGKVDNGTWMAIFSSNVTVLDAGTPEAAAVQAAAGDTPLAPVQPSSTAPLEGGQDPATDAEIPAVFTASLDTTPAKKKTTTKSRRRDDTSPAPKRKRTRSERDTSRTPTRTKPRRERTSDSGDSNSSSCGGALRRPV